MKTFMDILMAGLLAVCILSIGISILRKSEKQIIILVTENAKDADVLKNQLEVISDTKNIKIYYSDKKGKTNVEK